MPVRWIEETAAAGHPYRSCACLQEFIAPGPGHRVHEHAVRRHAPCGNAQPLLARVTIGDAAQGERDRPLISFSVARGSSPSRR